MMHKLQENLLNLAETRDLGSLSLRELGRVVGEDHPQNVKYHLDQLINRGLLVKNKRTGSISLPDPYEESSGFISLPILGSANCGEPLMYADGAIEGYLKLSSSMLAVKKKPGMFVVRATGDSMNMANINGATIEDGDFVIAVSDDVVPDDGDYVISTIDGKANIKRLRRRPELKQVILASESIESIPPIIVAEEDADSFVINGLVTQVVKT